MTGTVMVMQLDGIKALVASEWQAMNQLIIDSLYSSVPFVQDAGHYMINGGGKRVRPLVVLLGARACAYAGEDHLALAAIVEFIHTATLLHDDVIDAGQWRRGQPTVNHLHGNSAAVLVGDFLYSRAFQMLVKLGHLSILGIMADATAQIAEGEVMQLLFCRQTETQEADYFAIIQRKTACLFEAAAEMAALLANVPLAIQLALKGYGQHLGMAFQLVDDALDYQIANPALGKATLQDLAEGKATLPLIHCLQQADPETLELTRQAIQAKDLSLLRRVQEAVDRCGGIEYTMRSARQEAERAIACLQALPDSAYRDGMRDLAEFAIARIN